MCNQGGLCIIYQVWDKERHQALIEGVEYGDPECTKVVLLNRNRHKLKFKVIKTHSAHVAVFCQ